MTLTADQYIASVSDHLPRSAPERQQIEMELRSLIAERVERGQPLADVLKHLGDPRALAESYLAEIPLVAGGFWERGAAKVLDLLTLLIGAVVLVLPIVLVLREWGAIWLAGSVVVLISVALCLGFYTALMEWHFGATVGKMAMRLRVVRESGARISFGQSLVRQLPQWLQVFWIDVLFAIFTDRKQRAFELLSKTRVVRVNDSPAMVVRGATS